MLTLIINGQTYQGLPGGQPSGHEVAARYIRERTEHLRIAHPYSGVEKVIAEASP